MILRSAILLLLVTLILAPPQSARAEAPGGDFFDAIVRVEARVPPDAYTAAGLGTERGGSGVVIDDDGLVLTIGYLILEAESVELVARGRRVSATVIAYDYDSGLGLVRALTPLEVAPMELGDSGALENRSTMLVAAHGGTAAAQRVIIVSRREFAGYWEYLLEDAIFTAPAYPDFGGAALIGPDGRLVGIGSLVVKNAVAGPTAIPGNLFVPIDLLKPIFGDLLAHGRATGPQRPWLGMFGDDLRGHVFVNRVAPGGPAEAAGLVENDIVLAVAGRGVSTLAGFYRAVWGLGPAGVEVPLTVVHGAKVREVVVHSADRYDHLLLNPGH